MSKFTPSSQNHSRSPNNGAHLAGNMTQKITERNNFNFAPSIQMPDLNEMSLSPEDNFFNNQVKSESNNPHF